MSNHYIYTYTGLVFDLLEPKPEMICLKDIFFSLAITNRFTGHTLRAYSVLEHSIRGAEALLADNFDNESALNFLMHDAAEAYTGDMASPLKALCPGYRAIQDHIDAVIGQKYGTAHTANTKLMDLRMYVTERRDLIQDGDGRLTRKDAEPLKYSIRCSNMNGQWYSRSWLVKRASPRKQSWESKKS